LLREQRCSHGRKITVTPPLFPGYLFLWVVSGWWDARWAAGVRRLVMDGPVPARVPEAGGIWLLSPPPTLRERGHACLARRLVAVRRRAILMVAEGERNFLASKHGLRRVSLQRPLGWHGTYVADDTYDVFVSYSRADGRHAAEIDFERKECPEA